MDKLDKKINFGHNIFYKYKSEQCIIYQIKDSTGEGVMTTFSVFPGGFSIDIYKLKKKFEVDGKSFIMRASPVIENIFSELYNVPDKIRQDYFRVKVLELLLLLEIMEVSDKLVEKPYFFKKEVEKIKEIKKFITNNIDKHYTLEELSKLLNLNKF